MLAAFPRAAQALGGRPPVVAAQAQPAAPPPQPVQLPKLVHSFLEQWAYVISTEKLNAVCCSRRAGKTQAAILRAVMVLARPDTWVHYVSLIRRNARKQFFNKLLVYLEKSPAKGGLGWVRGRDFWVNKSEMLLDTAWGSHLQALSCDDMAGIKSVKGDRSDLFMVDECQEPNDDVLAALIDQAAMPMLTDTGGMLDLLGVAPAVEPCYFSKALDNAGWAHFSWTQFDHDYPRPREAKWQFVKKLLQDAGHKLDGITEATNDNGRLVLHVAPDTPAVVQREYFGKRVRDPKTVAYEYSPGWNDYDPSTINLAKGDWRIIWGFDIGYGDHDAIVVGATREGDPKQTIYVLWSWHHRHLDVFHDADFMAAVREVLPPSRTIGDDGGHGAVKTLKGLSRRLAMPVQPKPRDVMVSVGLTNDELRTRRLLLPTSDVYTQQILEAARRLYAAEPERLQLVESMLLNQPTADVPDNKKLNLGDELQQVRKTVNPRTGKFEINKKGKHSDGSEAFRYMVSGFVRPPADPQEVPVTDPDELNQRAIDAYEERWRKSRSGRRWA